MRRCIAWGMALCLGAAVLAGRLSSAPVASPADRVAEQVVGLKLAVVRRQEARVEQATREFEEFPTNWAAAFRLAHEMFLLRSHREVLRAEVGESVNALIPEVRQSQIRALAKLAKGLATTHEQTLCSEILLGRTLPASVRPSTGGPRPMAVPASPAGTGTAIAAQAA